VEYGLKMNFNPVSEEGMGFCFYGRNQAGFLRRDKMKKIALILLATVVILGGCGLANSIYLNYNFSAGMELTTSVGNPMVEITQACKNGVHGKVHSSITFQLIYSGKSVNTIRITYREFSNDLTRPTFSQDLTYDISERKKMDFEGTVFEGTVIEVKEASNSFITFVVLESPVYRYPSGSKVMEC
jgi:hypothetical protein